MDILVKEVNRREVLKYLGHMGHDVPEEIEVSIDECIEEIKKISKPKYIWREFNIERKIENGEEKIFLENTKFELIGKDIKNMLRECDRCILMAATLGVAIDNRLRIQQIRDMTTSIILDSCASSAIESVCNQINDELEHKYAEEGLFLTDRFSPGYGDMPIEVQRDFVRLMDTSRKIGLNVSSSGLMIPRKSVTAIIGISHREQTKRFSGCENCNMFMNCEYRKSGVTCGRE